MEVNKNETHFDQPSPPGYTVEDTLTPSMPPPYTDDPPAYSDVIGGSGVVYTSAPVSLDHMSKLPYGDTGNISSQSQLQPLGMQHYGQEPRNPQTTVQQFYYQETSSPYTSSAEADTPQTPQPDTTTRSSNSPPARQQSTQSITPHKDLLQPTPSRIVETKTSRHGKTKSHIKDLETGKEYFIKEKVSRHGHRSKTVVVEVGGPKTKVIETPKRTVVCQKKK